MSLKASDSSKNLILPVSDPPKDQDGKWLYKVDDKLSKGFAMTKRGAYAAISYMSCAGESFIMSDNSPIFVPLKTLRHIFPLAGTYLLYMSVCGVNVSRYTTLRGSTVVFTMLMEYILVRQGYTSSVIFRNGDSEKTSRGFQFVHVVLVNLKYGFYNGGLDILLKSFQMFPIRPLLKRKIHVSHSRLMCLIRRALFGAWDLSFDAYGYAVVFMSNITTAIYLATIARVGKTSSLNSFGLMWCNGIICGLLLLSWTFFRGDLMKTIDFPYLFSPGFLVVLLFSCILTFFLNYSIFLNTALSSALTRTICGNLKDLFTIDLGWILFGGLPFDFWNVIGQLIGFVGSGLYAYYKLIGK